MEAWRVYDIGEEEVKKALEAELEWLIESGVVSGLSEEDLEAIVSAAELGCAGWNSKLVWSDGEWIPYELADGAMILRCVGVPPSLSFPAAGPGSRSPARSWPAAPGRERLGPLSTRPSPSR